MTYTNKTYVAFDADNDIYYYRLMQAWKQNDNTNFNFYDAHDLNNLMSWASEYTIKDKLQERLRNTKVFLVLVGEKTKFLYKFVKWEIEQAIKRGIPIIVINLNGKRYKDNDLCPLSIDDQLSLHISFNQKIIAKALDEWEKLDKAYRDQGKNGPYKYSDDVYKNLGL